MSSDSLRPDVQRCRPGAKTRRLEIHIGRVGRIARIKMCGISVLERQMRRVMRWFSANSPDRDICANFETDIAFPKGSWHEPLRAVRA